MKKLLLADDSVTIQKVVELVLADEGFELKMTGNGEEALEALSSFRPDVVLADVEMPKMDGYELSRTIKGSPATQSIPVILMVGAFETVDEDLIRKAGADDYVIKPFESHDLISKLRSVLPVEEEAIPAAEAFNAAETFSETLSKASEALPGASEAPLKTSGEGGPGESGPAGRPADERLQGAMEEVVSEEYVEEVAVPPIEEPHQREEGAEKTEPETLQAAPAWKAEATQPAPEAPETHAPLSETPAIEKTVSPEEIRAAIEARVGAAVDEAVGKLDFARIAASAVEARVGASIDEAIGKLDLARVMAEAAAPAMSAAAQKIAGESLPGVVESIAESVVKSLVSGAVAQASAGMKETIEQIVRQAVPELAESIIKKEIESIKREI